MNPLILLGGIAFGLAFLLGRQRSRIRLSEGHARRRELIRNAWRERDRAAIARAQEAAAATTSYGLLTESQRDVYRATRERLEELKRAA